MISEGDRARLEAEGYFVGDNGWATKGGKMFAAAEVLQSLTTAAGTSVTIEPVAAQDESGAVDVVDLAAAIQDGAEPMVIGGLQRPRSILAITGEEGEGKTMLSEQLTRELVRGESILGFFPPGDVIPKRVLYVDTHQERPEVEARCRDMDRRGLVVERGRVFWWLHDLDLTSYGAGELASMVRATGADYLWFDAGSHVVPDPNDTATVNAMFAYLSDLMREYDICGVGMTLFNRKRASGDYSRRFDDLFGSREWKGRVSQALYLEGNRITCWKDRGGHVRQVWPGRAGGRYAYATLLRPGLEDPSAVPFRISTEETGEDFDAEAVAAKALALVEGKPGTYTKSSLADALGVKRERAVQVIAQLLTEGRIGPNEPRKRLSIPATALL
jgi:hypothetical protein